MENMPGMSGMEPPQHDSHETMIMSHMTFFWGKNAEILFSGWPGTRSGMYALALIFVFVLSAIVEWLSQYCTRNTASCGGLSGRAVRTAVHGLRVGLGYIVMLAVMSFNGGVLIVAVAGHILGFFLFGSKVFGAEKDFSRPAGC